MPVLIFFLTACATTSTVTQLPPMQPLTGNFTEEKIDSEVRYGDDILVFHKTQGQLPIKFARVNEEYLFFFDVDEKHNLYSDMDGRIYLKDIERIEMIKRSPAVAPSDFYKDSSKEKYRWAGAGFVLLAIILLPIMIVGGLTGGI